MIRFKMYFEDYNVKQTFGVKYAEKLKETRKQQRIKEHEAITGTCKAIYKSFLANGKGFWEKAKEAYRQQVEKES